VTRKPASADAGFFVRAWDVLLPPPPPGQRHGRGFKNNPHDQEFFMCSIFGIFGLQPGDDLQALRRQALDCSQRQRHRGPDWSGVYVDDGAILVHERLAIVDPAGGSQPLLSADGHLALAVNGEIYNHRELKQQLTQPYAFQTGSDCEVINALYREDAPAALLNRLNGIFAFALWDKATGRVLIARDPMGVCPLYWGHDQQGRLRVASEMKSLADSCADVAQFPPGHYYDSVSGELLQYYRKPWRDYAAVQGVQVSKQELREAFERAVHRQLMTDVPYGVLLSGGLDSSLVAAVAARFARKRIEDNDEAEAWWPRLHSFAIGLKGSPDLAAAAIAAESLGTVHHGFEYTFEEGLDALPEVIRHIETYDVTTIRASTPMFLLARRIKAMGVKMVLSGEGSDEIFGGYLYFHKAPNAREFHEELIRKLDALYNYDCLRANKSMMAWGVEPRVPFLDVEFLDVAMRMDAQYKMIDKTSGGATRMEKGVLREAFEGYLPDSILWRQKEQFSDGVGYGWIDGLKAHAEAQVSDRELAAADKRFPVNPPQTKEAYYYRTLFERVFPTPAAAETVPGGKSIACSSPAAIAWDASFANAADPSGRAVAGVHAQALGA
jgi:asparagine synthase (glutamine-hydrolysing)